MTGTENIAGSDRKIRCFAIMPFADAFNGTWEAIQEVSVKDCQLETFRADTRHHHSMLLENILGHIHSTDITVIDVSDLNPNVLFEFGYAAATRKYIIPITKSKIESLPSDLRSYIFLSYADGSSDEFKIELRNRLRQVIKLIKSDLEKKQLEEKTYIVKP